MENLGVIDLYEKTNLERSKKFIEKTTSTLRVETDKKKVTRDIEWIDMMLNTIPYIDNIFRSPNRFIVNEEEVVKIEQAKKITVETIKHLSKNTNFIQTIDEKTGDVTPSKLLNVRKEESYDTYENRLIYTLIQNMRLFIKRRKESLEKEVGIKNNEEENKDSNSTSNAKNILQQIEELENKISSLTTSEVYKVIDKQHISLVREPIKKTNVVLKNVNFQYAMKLWTYLRDNFDDKTAHIEEKQDYMDNGGLKQLIDETFLLQYLSMKTLDDDKIENQETNEEIKDIMVEQLIDKMLDMDVELTEKQLKNMIANRYEVIRYKKMEIIQELQKIFKEHIEKYIKKVEKRG